MPSGRTPPAASNRYRRMAHDTAVTFRAASVADSLAAAQVNLRSAHDSLPAVYAHADDLSVERRAAMFRRRFGAAFYRMVVAEAPGPGVVGFVDVGLPRNGRWGCDAELYAIYVLGPYQRSGVGRRLFELACEAVRAQGLDSMYLIVLQDNPSRAFYERLGGRALAHVPAGAVAGQDAHVIYAWSGLCRPTGAPPPTADPARPQ
jgi:ribosomal protein S18 acetylase RimI-like enzyme